MGKNIFLIGVFMFLDSSTRESYLYIVQLNISELVRSQKGEGLLFNNLRLRNVRPNRSQMTEYRIKLNKSCY